MTKENQVFLPYGRHSIDDEDIAAVERVLKSDWLTTGPKVDNFEQEFAQKVGAKYAVVCSSATTGLHLAALALGLGKGDKVIVPTLTFLATANAVRYVDADVVFCDVDPDTGLMTIETLERAFHSTPGVKAIFPVQLNGQCADMIAVSAFAKLHGLAIVEDACHAIGGTVTTSAGTYSPVGSCAMSDMTVFSLHPVKTITMGEGGVVTTNNENFYKKMKSLRSHGMVRELDTLKNEDLAFNATGDLNPWYYEMQELGFNFRASALQCALGASQLKKLDAFVEKRQELVNLYDKQLASLFPNVRPIARVPYGQPAWHLYVVLIDFEAAGIDRATLMHALHAKGIGTQVHYLPVHLQPYYQGLYGEKELAGANAYYAHCLSLPLFPEMNAPDVEHVVHTLTTMLC
ncbi:MAG: UDP-4-amino-4,6-dideoxy-N-acetyl-beta-L-altrosamine transaminase [Rhodospirillales bacterium]|nr:UDP-4-amino-4,6-dideoxy-N-acetyl-beta-L-altrosamine transaminase [Rhodospirillales bacterium]